MLGTGARIGESLAVLWSQVDLEAAIDITHTIVRVRGEGLIRKRSKSNASQRQVGLPNWLIATSTSRQFGCLAESRRNSQTSWPSAP